jgi:hypothetical protein
MEKETLKNIFNFIEKNEGHKTPFMWKLKNEIPLTEEELNVKGNLDLERSKITSLPEGLYVKGNLDLSNSKITSLPKGLKVGSILIIIESELLKYSDKEIRKMIEPGYIKGKIIREYYR